MSNFQTLDEQIEEWSAEALKLGREAGIAAGSWAADGNTPESHADAVLSMLAEGDPEAYDYLPDVPNLSGEWADGETPKSLFETVTGLDSHAEASWRIDSYQKVVDALCQAWEDGVAETFEPECQRVLSAAGAVQAD